MIAYTVGLSATKSNKTVYDYVWIPAEEGPVKQENIPWSSVTNLSIQMILHASFFMKP